jgi:hypothetical protein
VAGVAGLTDRERYGFDVRGFLVRRGVLNAKQLAELNRAWDALGLRPPGRDVPSQRFTGHLPHHAAFRALLDHPAVFDVVLELCGDGLRLDHTDGIVMAPGTSGLGLHGGATPFDPAQFYVAEGARLHCGLVAALWSLVGSGPGDGGFACVPGSHKAAFALPRDVDVRSPEVMEVPLGPGDVVIFTEALTHGTLPWQASHERRILAYKYSPGSSSWGKDEVLPPELAPLLTARQRLLFEPPYVAYRRPLR